MTAEPVHAATSSSAQPLERRADLAGLQLRLAQSMWVLVTVVAVALFSASVPIYYDRLRTLSLTHSPYDQSTVQVGLAELGISTGLFAFIYTAILVISALAFVGVGVLIFWRKPDDRAALLSSGILVMFGVIWPNTLTDLGEVYSVLELPTAIFGALGFAGFLLLFYVFPDGRFVPRWTWPLGILLVIEVTGHEVFPSTILDTETWPGPLSLIFLIFPITIVYAQIHRYRKVSTPLQRQQTKWVVFSLIAAIVCFVAYGALGSLPVINEDGVWTVLYLLGGVVFNGFVFLLIPIAIALAVLRYRLWDIDPIINRTLVYAALTVCVVAVYVIVVGWLGVVFRTESNIVFSLVATGLVAVLFQPVRERLQRLVNRLMYGERDDPYSVIARLGQRLEAALAPDAVLPAIVSTIAEALKLPYAAIALRRGDGQTIVASIGAPVADPVRLLLVYQHEVVGELSVSRRSPEETFSSADQRLLEDFARQAGVAAHAVQLTADLQQARERLVEAREEERRRLRRDLHDGLGSQLAALNMELGALQRAVHDDPETATAHIREIRDEIRNAIADIRRIAHDLRPPVIDDLGLIAALHARAEQYTSEGLAIHLDLPDDMPCLSAAVEVALYRIVEEALTNVVRHAQARRCSVRLVVDDALELIITDDGVGIDGERETGVGLLSIRERAEELGGSFTIEPAMGGGTRILVRLPLAREKRNGHATHTDR
jgi:signal transduction histidine kinase